MLVTAPPEVKIDPRVKRTRALIQKSFAELLANQSFKSITVQKITDLAEINRATFYAHFPDKFALLKDSIRQEFQQELENRVLSACDYSDENLSALIVTVCQFIAQSSEHCPSSDSQFKMLVEAEVKGQIQDVLEYWLEQIDSKMDPGYATTAASWTIYGLSLRWYHKNKSPNNPPVDQFAEQVKLLIKAILKTPGLGTK